MKEWHSAATQLQAAWRMDRAWRKHRKITAAGRKLVSAAVMWQIKRNCPTRILVAKKLQALWLKQKLRRSLARREQAAVTIQKWYRSLLVMRVISDVAVSILVQSKLMQERWLQDYAIEIQRAFRRWRNRRTLAKRATRGVVRLQAEMRRRLATAHVQRIRYQTGFGLHRLFSKPVHPVLDKHGKLSCYRPDGSKTSMHEGGKVMMLVNLESQPEFVKDELAGAAARVQSWWRWRWFWRAVVRIQKVWRGRVARNRLKQKADAAARLQRQFKLRKSMKEFQQLRLSAIQVQTMFRMSVQTNKYHEAKEQRLRATQEVAADAAALAVQPATRTAEDGETVISEAVEDWDGETVTSEGMSERGRSPSRGRPPTSLSQATTQATRAAPSPPPPPAERPEKLRPQRSSSRAKQG